VKRRSKIEPNTWAANLMVTTAVELRDALDAYPTLAARRLEGDDTVVAPALDLAQRIAAIRRAVVLRAAEVRAGTTESLTPLRAGAVLCQLECALVGLAQDLPDERAQLDEDQLQTIVEQADLSTWMSTVISAAEKQMGPL
jgi:hypothetical protein